MTTFFEFPEDRYWVGGPKVVAVGPTGVVMSQFPEEQLLKTFGGYVSYVDELTGRSFTGVCHGPRVAHFYRALKARGVPIAVVHERPAKLRLQGRLGV